MIGPPGVRNVHIVGEALRLQTHSCREKAPPEINGSPFKTEMREDSTIALEKGEFRDFVDKRRYGDFCNLLLSAMDSEGKI